MNVKALSNDPRQTELASKFTVAQYEACGEQDKSTIAEALHRRFQERYIDPVTPQKGAPMHGFTMMAISCLMIESLESFCQGWEDSNDGRGKEAFRKFFDRHNQFIAFRSHYAKFYKNVRCGILHQAETTGGWKITRKVTAPLFVVAPSPTVNAFLFLKHLQTALDGFCDALKTADWNSSEWKNVRRKMKSLCNNCRP
jgi:hypothetical protein